MFKSSNIRNISNKTIVGENFPNLTQKFSQKKNFVLGKSYEKEQKKKNYISLFNSLKQENRKKSLFFPINKKSEKILSELPLYKSESKNNNRYKNIMGKALYLIKIISL